VSQPYPASPQLGPQLLRTNTARWPSTFPGRPQRRRGAGQARVARRAPIDNALRVPLIEGFGVRLPRALTAAFIDQALKASEGIAGLSAAMRGLIAARTAVYDGGRGDRRRHEAHGKSFGKPKLSSSATPPRS